MTARTSTKAVRAATPRRRSSPAKRTAPSRDTPGQVATSSRQPAANGAALAGLTLAIVFAALGFLFHPFWVVAIIVMAVLWGSFATGRRRTASDGGLVAEAVAAVVHEAHDISDIASSRLRNGHDDEPGDTRG